MSMSGSPTGTTCASSIAARYQLPSDSRTASSSTASRPTRLITTGGGALPARKPGTRMLRASSFAACVTRRSTSPGPISASTRTRDSGSSVVVVLMSVAMRAAVERYKGARMRERFAAWFVTGPLGHLASGVADWAVLLWHAACEAAGRPLRRRRALSRDALARARSFASGARARPAAASPSPGGPRRAAARGSAASGRPSGVPSGAGRVVAPTIRSISCTSSGTRSSRTTPAVLRALERPRRRVEDALALLRR